MKRVLEPQGPAAAFVLSDDEVAAIGGGRKVFPVTVTVGDYTFAGRLARMGGKNLVGLNRAVREAGGLEIGTEYDVEILADDAPREVEVPPELATALADAGLRQAFDAYAPSHRKEWARSVVDAKKEDTRDRRIAKVLEALRG
jgi:hypothetical protein